ncbi:MAG: site-specific integrase [Myxococcales bacterium]|nr:site-specific integrase [Myxococcales bacterium]
MPRKPTGEVYWVHDVARTRIPLQPGKRAAFVLPSCRTADAAAARSALMAEVALRLRPTLATPAQVEEMLTMLGKASERSLPSMLGLVDELAGGTLSHMKPMAPTFREVGERWTDGLLHKQYPDQVKLKRSAGHDVARLTRYVYPVIGDTPIDRVTLDQCEAVMARLPEALTPATRRNIGQLMTKIMRMAVYPLRLIRENPIPSGFLPTAKKPRALAYIYPDEEQRLLACTAVPLPYRVLWGFLAREGMRKGEAMSLTWSALDLIRGAVRLDKNKTDDPRAWALDPGVTAALRAFKARDRASAGPSSSTTRASRLPRRAPSAWHRCFAGTCARSASTRNARSSSRARKNDNRSAYTTCVGRSSQ